MKIKYLLFVTLFVIITSPLFSQTSLESLVNEGIQLHDQGNYDQAIKKYKKALKLDSKSSLVNYELALSYFSLGDYKKAIKYSDKVINQNKDHLIPAYMTKGSSLDLLGKTDKSIELFKEAIIKTGGHYLLSYNLALNYFNSNDLINAEKSVIDAININSDHNSSHLMLAMIHNQLGNPIQTVLSSHYFLLLEPSTNRSAQAYQMLQDNFGKNVEKEDAKTINLNYSPSDDNPFSSAELMLSIIEASRYLEDNVDKTDDQLFVEFTKSLFSFLGADTSENDNLGWWKFYTSFFNSLEHSGHIETYCKYITQDQIKSSKDWLKNHPDKLEDFEKWVEN